MLTPNLRPFTPSTSIEIELVYKDANHQDNYFTWDGQPIYTAHMPLYLDKNLLDIIEATEEFIPEGKKLRIYDGYRPPSAQEKMAIIRDKKGYRKDMVSGKGEGGHPRGMAVDVALVDVKNDYGCCTVDYGCGFDDFTLINKDTGYPTETLENAIPLAGRNTKFIPFLAKQNRLGLEALMQKAALKRNLCLMPLAQEWWDFRFPENESDLKYVLASFNRIIFDMYGDAPDVNDYAEFCAYWNEHYNEKKLPPEKRHILGPLPKAEMLDMIYFGEYEAVEL